MPANPPNDMPRITPNLYYDDPGAALEWLSKAFGLETRMSMPGPDGSIMHAEMQVADSVIMMSPTSANDRLDESARAPGVGHPGALRVRR